MQTQIEEDNLIVAKRLEAEDFSSQRFLDGLSEDIEWWVAGSPGILPWAGVFKGRSSVANWVKVLRDNLNYQKRESDWLVKGIPSSNSFAPVDHMRAKLSASGR